MDIALQGVSELLWKKMVL